MPRDHAVEGSGTVDVQRDVVPVDAADDLDRALDARHRRHAGDDGAEQGLEALLGGGHVLEQVLDRRVPAHRRRSRRVAEPVGLHRRDHARVGARVVTQHHAR
jgi:hypothetical protein